MHNQTHEHCRQITTQSIEFDICDIISEQFVNADSVIWDLFFIGWWGMDGIVGAVGNGRFSDND